MNLYEMLKARIVGYSNDFLTNIYAQTFAQPAATWHEYTGTLPYTITSDGTIAILSLKGNTSNASSCGESTNNLFDSAFTIGYYLNATTGLPTATNDPRMSTLVPVDVTDYNSVTFNYEREVTFQLNVMYSIFNGSTLVSRVAGKSIPLTIDTSEATKLYLCVYPPDTSKPLTTDSISSITLNSGSSSLPYEPNGYKIPIVINSTTTNIYIGKNPLRKSLDGTAVDELATDGTLTRRVDSDGSVLATPVVSQITMPTFNTAVGSNTISADTTVQPSEVYIKWKG